MSPLLVLAAVVGVCGQVGLGQSMIPVQVGLLPDLRLKIGWPETPNNVSLERLSELGAGAFWQPVVSSLQRQGGQISVTLLPEPDREFFRLRDEGPAPLAGIAASSPAPGESDVSVHRETILEFTRPLAAGMSLHSDLLYATFGEGRMLSRLELSSNRRELALFYLEPVPAGSRVRATFNSAGLLDDLGRPLDPDGSGNVGGAVWMDFDTAGSLPVSGTAVIGHVFASDPVPDGNGGLGNGFGVYSCFLKKAPFLGLAVSTGAAAYSLYRNCLPCRSDGQVSAAGSAIARHESHAPRHEQEFEAHLEFLAAYQELIDVYLGSTRWTSTITLDTPDGPEAVYQLEAIITAFLAAAGRGSDGGAMITLAEAGAIGALPRPLDFDESDVSDAIDHINRTISLYQQNLTTHEAAGRTDFVATWAPGSFRGRARHRCGRVAGPGRMDSWH